VKDKNMKNDVPTENNHIGVDIPASALPEGNWKTIDVAVLFDKDKCDLAECAVDDVYRILE
jgi:hypothetical protein